MSLKNQDGTAYKLRGPNPLTKTQNYWKEEVVFHNLKWDSIPTDKPTLPVTVDPPPVQMDLPKLVLEEKPKPAPKATGLKNIVLIHCLPAIENAKQNELYGEVRSETGFGAKTVIEAVIIEEGILGMRLWTPSPVTTNSILYPSRYKTGEKINQLQWWKVVSTEPYSKGFYVDSVVSSYQPAFT